MKILRPILLAGTLSCGATAGFAADILIHVPNVEKTDTATSGYMCGGTAVNAEYINAGGVSLVRLTIGSDLVVAANVLSGSGAKYAGGPYIFWTKGNDAQLWDLRAGGENGPGVVCKPLP